MWRRVRAASGVWDRALRGRPRAPSHNPLRHPLRRLFLLLGVLGPGLIAANAGNDAGGIATYSVDGARYGYALLWLMVVITVSLIVVQEMAARMGMVTGKGLAELIREHYGVRWSTFSTVSVLIANLGICISEFVGIGAALGLIGVPVQVSAPIAAILARPDWGAVGRAAVVPQIHLTSAFLLLFVATAGTTITPFMQLYVQSAVVDRGLGVEDLRAERIEVATGSIFANLIACFIIIATGATLYLHGIRDIGSAADAAKALVPFAGRFAEILFATGLLGASLLAAAILPVTAAYVVAETFGFEKGIARRPREAPVFVGVITALIAIGTLVAIIPGMPVISLLIVVQAVNGVLLPVTLFFVWRLASNKELMGEYANGHTFNILAGATVIATSALSLALLAVTIGGVFGL